MHSSNARLKYAKEKHYCPHCQTQLSCCTVPPVHVGDGLGWGTEIFFICLNNSCSLYVNGWAHCEEQYGHSASYRHMLLPGEASGTAMMVGSEMAFTGSEIDPNEAASQDDRYQAEKEAVEQLATCVAEKNLAPVLTLILDDDAVLEGRDKACELLVPLNDLACIDPIRNHKFRHTSVMQKANLAIEQILAANFMKECPHCAEIIKRQAKICKHCGK